MFVRLAELTGFSSQPNRRFDMALSQEINLARMGNEG